MENNKVRVLHLGSPTGLYGAERWILALINNIEKKDIEIIVAVILDDPKLNADLCKEAEKIGVQTKIFEAYGRINWSAVKQLREYLFKNRIDILHTHGYKTDIIGLIAAYGTGCKLITTPHGWSKKAGFKLKIYEAADRFAFCFFDAIAPLSEDIYNGLSFIPLLRNKLRLIVNGVDIKDISRVNNIAAEVKKWKDDDYFVIGYIGQLIERKGLDILLKAVSDLKIKKWRLAIVGEGSEKSKLIQLVNDLGLDDKVVFFGFRSDRISFLKGFDLFVLPSRLEGIPRCLMEAMAANVPVIASAIPGCCDLIENGETGFLFEMDNFEKLSQIILALLADKKLRDNLASNAREIIERKWSASSMAECYYKLYHDFFKS